MKPKRTIDPNCLKALEQGHIYAIDDHGRPQYRKVRSIGTKSVKAYQLRDMGGSYQRETFMADGYGAEWFLTQEEAMSANGAERLSPKGVSRNDQ